MHNSKAKLITFVVSKKHQLILTFKNQSVTFFRYVGTAYANH